MTLGRKAFYVIEGVQWAGQAVLLTEQGFEEVDRLRNGVMSRLAENVAQIQAARARQPGRSEARRPARGAGASSINEGEDATIEVFGRLVRSGTR